MGKTRSAGWVGGTVVFVLAIFFATYFFLYQPRADATAQTKVETQDTRSRNDLLEIRVVELRAEFARLDEYREELAAIAVQIPREARLADMTRMITDLATQNAVTIIELSPGAAMVVTLPIPAVVASAEPSAPAGTDTDGTAIDQAEETAQDAEVAADAQDDTEAPVDPALPTAPVQIEGFVTVPITIKVLGPYPNVLAFLDQLQRRDGRLFLPSSLDSARLKMTEAAGGKPAIADGDLELMITGYTYVLVDVPGVTPVTSGEDVEEPEEPAMPRSDRNPFIPLVPSSTAG